MKVSKNYPRFFTEEEGHLVADEVRIDEIIFLLKKFSKDKRSDSDGWKIEFFLDFFYLIGKDLMKDV